MPRYRLKMDDDPNFGSPLQVDTASRLVHAGLAPTVRDGTWYWKVAFLDASNRESPYSPHESFYKGSGGAAAVTAARR
ncbi:MAG: hypothetical protein IPO15_19370 [Anaerolineae bacterium]|uniref:hypothetical protein n=1 Tax=Candidatus Amarolinea dominans TaxID=3140696 RepID=UPI003136E1C9|nr:hypothetical protein [Anaerolineae bacterium]